MTALHLDALQAILGCAIIVFGFLAGWKGKAIYKRLKAGTVIAWLWVYGERASRQDRD